MTAVTVAALRITEESTRPEIAEAITHLGQRARREFPVVGTEDQPTPWDLRHQAIDMLLVDWERARA